MKTYKYAIIGGGLAGLYAGFKLSEQGIDDYVILEAANDFGGRIKPFEAEGFDLGATWFWSEIFNHKKIRTLISWKLAQLLGCRSKCSRIFNYFY